MLVLLLVIERLLPPKPAGLSDQQVANVTENILKAIDTNRLSEFHS